MRSDSGGLSGDVGSGLAFLQPPPLQQVLDFLWQGGGRIASPMDR